MSNTSVVLPDDDLFEDFSFTSTFTLILVPIQDAQYEEPAWQESWEDDDDAVDFHKQLEYNLN